MTTHHITAPATQRLKVEISGAVQGVGFRPFVYRLAAQLALTGWVINDTRGVFIEVEGPPARLSQFLARLSTDHPPRAIIHTLTHHWLESTGYMQFEIRHSRHTGAKTVLVLPDIATCPDCLAEVLNPADRRYGYPFTNCTNCGPRFTIIQALPYDRPNTTMRHFTMCPHCQAEYDDPLNRRFHAQPNACPVCGPQLELRFTTADTIPANGNHPNALADPLLEAVAALRAGQIVAVKGLGGFHLMVDAANAAAVARLRRQKPRQHKPFAVMARDLPQAESLVQLDDPARQLLSSAEAPIVLLPRRANAPLADNVAPDNPNLGIMLPYTPLHHRLLRALGGPVVATSGNLSDEPICTDETEAMARLGHLADLFLVHNRPIERHADDSIAWLVQGQPRLLRRARGYAPLPVLLKEAVPPILAVGAHLKNTVALSVGRQAFISQHIGDLETAEAMAAFERVIADFQRLYETAPAAIAHDLHPDYLSTKWAKEEMGDRRLAIEHKSNQSLISNPQSPILIPVQHHHAHLAACLAEHGQTGPALGIIWDGTGYGPDGSIWGGEFLLGDAAGFTRVAHLRPFRLPGGDAAVKEPRRVALALLWEIFGEAALDRVDLPAIGAINPTDRQLLGQMLRKTINSPVTTSAGRLFDGVAALAGLHPQVSFEGQAAMALEFAADPHETEAYPLEVDTGRPMVLNWQPMLKAILVDVQAGASVGAISARFHNGLVQAMVAVARQVGQPVVALSGGCFQNRRLTEQAARALQQAGFEVLLHRQVPPNDGGISLGQIAVAAAALQTKNSGNVVS